jgi:type II secretory pathway pseudopilin PulG
LNELVITMLVLGVLASIAIPSFLGSRNNSYDKEAQASVEVVLRAARLLYQSQGDFSTGSSAQCGDSALLAADLQKLEPNVDDVASSVSSTNSRVVSVQAVQTWNSNAELLGCQGFYAVALSSSGSCWAARFIVEGKFLAAGSVSPVAVAQQTNTSNKAVTTWTALAVNGTAFGALKPQTSAADGNNTNNLASIKTYCNAKEQSTGSPTVDGLYIAPSQFYATWRDVAPGGTASNVSAAAAAAAIAAAAGTGSLWTSRTAASAQSWVAVAYGDGRYVAVGNNAVMTSTDGITWTSGTPATSDEWWGVAYGNSIWVAVSYNGTVMTSTNGTAWTQRFPPAGNEYFGVTYGNGLFVAVGETATGSPNNQIITSPDGINWTVRSSPVIIRWHSVAYGNNLFVAVARDGTATNRVMTSTDGITWTSQTSVSGAWRSVAYGNGLWVATQYSSNGIMTSPDGITWTARTTITGTAQDWSTVVYGSNTWVAVAITGTKRVMTSPDAITWTSQSSADDSKQWYALTYGGGKLVAVAPAAGSAVGIVMTG